MFSALRFFTILPLPSCNKPDAIWLTRHGWQASLSGVLIAIFCLALALGISPLLPAPLVAALTIALATLLSGALHEDGLADTADSLGVAKGQRLRVMHDPRCGSFAVIALILSFAIRTSALAFLFSQNAIAVSLLLLHPSARSVFPLWCRFVKPHPASSLARWLADARPTLFSLVSPFLVSASLAFVLLEPLQAILFLTTLAACSLLLLLFFQSFFEGLSGDLCGFGEQILECSLLVCLCLLQSV